MMFVLTCWDTPPAERPAMTDPAVASGPVLTLPICFLLAYRVEIQTQLSARTSDAFEFSLKETLMFMASV